MSAKTEVLILTGGSGAERDISLISADFIYSSLSTYSDLSLHQIEIKKNGERRDKKGQLCELRKSGEVISKGSSTFIQFAIPCFHGPPGETGDIQSLFEMMSLPYLGSGPEASSLCFNKISTKLWLEAIGIPTTPYFFITSKDQIIKASKKIEQWDGAFIKASSQGSSIGCFPAPSGSDYKALLEQAFNYSDFVLIEKALSPRELEVAVYEHNGELIISPPAEVTSHSGFYNFEEKYNKESLATTSAKASISSAQSSLIREHSKKAFECLKLKHLSRLDFFLLEDGKVYLNEINTFPGLTPISMFPKMLAENQHGFGDFLYKIIKREARNERN